MRSFFPNLDWADIDDLLTSVRPQGRAERVVLALAVLAALASVWFLVWATGGTRGPYTHAAYLPILFAGATLGFRAALASAGLVALLLGPFMPFDVAAGEPQRAANWLYRGGFYLLVGGFVGAGFGVVRARAQRATELRRELADTYSRNLRVFAALVEERDEQTYGHCERVGQNAVAVGRRLGLDARTLGRLYWAGLLHDLGKIGVPEAILRKPGPLTPEEFAAMKRHCEFGRAILLDVSRGFAPIADGLLAHHEKWDGSGYPRGLRGREIPLFGRILAVADVFEALTSHRPYREPMAREAALALLEEGRGRHFDPEVLDAFLAALEAGEIALESAPEPLATRQFVHDVLQPDAIGRDLTDPHAHG